MAAIIVSDQDFLRSMRRDPWLYLKENKGREYIIKGRVSNYQPFVDCLWINERPERIVLIFDEGSVSSRYDDKDIPKGATVTVKGKLNFIQWFMPDELYPSLIKCEILEVE